MAFAGLAIGVNDVNGATLPVKQDGPFDGGPTFCVLGCGIGMPRHHGHITLVHLTRFKQATDAALALNAARHDEQARGVLV